MVKPLKSQHGFTLIELIISLTIIAVILVIILGAFRVGIRAWEKGEKDMDNQQRYRIVLDLMRQQMMSISFNDIELENEQHLAFKGNSKSFEFLSHTALKPENKFGVVYVKYQVVEGKNDSERLLAFEKNALFLTQDFKPENIEPADFFELIPGAKNILFEYLKPPEQNLQQQSTWQESWDPEFDEGVPMAARLSVMDNSESLPLVVIIPFYHENQ